ncbi:MAG: hypothetical protein U0166_20420 [Acidobacteriota bacterium]
MEPSSPIHEALRTIPEPAALLEAFFARAPVALQVYRADGHCLLTNDAFRDLFAAVPPSEYNVLEDELLEKQGVLPAIRRAFGGEPVTIEPFWYDPRDLKKVDVAGGRRVAAGAHLFPIKDASGNIAYVALIFKDVTDELLAREAAEHAAASAERGRAEIEAILLNLPAGVGDRGSSVGEARRARTPTSSASSAVRSSRSRTSPGTTAIRSSTPTAGPSPRKSGRSSGASRRERSSPVRSRCSCVPTATASGCARAPRRSATGRVASPPPGGHLPRRHRAEAGRARARQSEEQFRAVFQHSGLGVLVAGLDGCGRRASTRRSRSCSATRRSARWESSVTHPDDYRSDHRAFPRSSWASSSYELDKRYIRKDGSTLHGRLVVHQGRAGGAAVRSRHDQDIGAEGHEARARAPPRGAARLGQGPRRLPVDGVARAADPATTLALGVDVLQSWATSRARRDRLRSATSLRAWPRSAPARRIERLIDRRSTCRGLPLAG